MPQIPADPAAVRQLLQMVCDYPMHRELGFELIEAADGRSRARVVVGPRLINIAGVVHGGNYYTLLDVVAFCAAVTVLPAGANATTHDFHATLMRPVKEGQVMDLAGRVLRLGKSVVFCDSEISVEGRLVAVGRVTKTVIPASWAAPS